jgi:hypothetical protein
VLSPLSQDQPARPTRRPPLSLRQEYQEFLLERIEEYKNSLTREDLLVIGDEAVRELELGAQSQYLLTEVLLLEHVDRIIARRLKLPAFRRWAQRNRALRQAQREPTHWGLGTSHPLVPWARRLEPGDMTVVVGAAALAEAMFLAAHDVDVFLLDQDLHAVEAAEQRAVTEQLASRFQALVLQFGGWFPDVLPALAVVAPSALVTVRARDRQALVRDLQSRTRPGGAHVVLATGDSPQVISLASGALHGSYVQAGWEVERGRGPGTERGRSGGRGKAGKLQRGGMGTFVATKPSRQVDTVARASE